jgi:hypothetical protein
MANISEFVDLYPEFTAIQEARLITLLDAVDGRVDPEFGVRRDEVIYLELADTLSVSAAGRSVRKPREGNKQSNYSAKLQELREIHALGRR